MQRDNTIEILEEEVSTSHPLGRFSLMTTSTSSASAREYHLRPESTGHEPGELAGHRHGLQRAEEYCSRVYAKCLENGGQPLKPIAPITPLTPSQPTYNGRGVYLLLFQQCFNTQPSTVEVKGTGGDDDTFFSSLLLRVPLQLPPSLAAYLSKQQQEENEGQLSSNVLIAVAILTRHATRIDLLRALEMPPSPSSSGSRWSTTPRLRAHQECIKMKQASRLVLTSLDTCQVSMKKVVKSVFVRYINKDLVHLGCRDVYESKYL
ncbi:Vam6/Vps39-like protein [Tyrophagus putrescentiae]|nr:Vam6/Vps39-like protein [Tyrophagus putrescentiae]